MDAPGRIWTGGQSSIIGQTIRLNGAAHEIVGVTPGSYTLEAEWSSEGKDYAVRLPLEVGPSDIDGINLVLTAGAQIFGRRSSMPREFYLIISPTGLPWSIPKICSPGRNIRI